MLTSGVPPIVGGSRRGNKNGHARQDLGRYHGGARHDQHAHPLVLRLSRGAIIELWTPRRDPASVLANGLPVAKGTGVMNCNRIAVESGNCRRVRRTCALKASDAKLLPTA